MRARGMGAQVIVTEVDPVRALEAVMDGFAVMPSVEAAQSAQVFITVTGGLKAIGQEHFEVMQDGAILSNSGHFNVEIDIPALEAMSTGRQEVRPYVEEFALKDGRHIYLLGDGRLINLTAAEGHPSSVMDMSFANQALAVEYLVTGKEPLTPGVYPVPHELDMQVGSLKLNAMGIAIDTLTEEQSRYLSGWQEGT